MPDWLLWLTAAGALVVAEMFTFTFVLLMLAGGAAAAALTAALGGPAPLQLVVGIITGGALVGLVRPIAARHLIASDPARTGTDALIGTEAVVLTRVDRETGLVRLNGGQWSARAYEPEQVIAAGTVVRVMQIDGATAVVWHDASDYGDAQDGDAQDGDAQHDDTQHG